MKTTIKRTFLAAMAAVTLLGGCHAATAPVVPPQGAKAVVAGQAPERIAAGTTASCRASRSRPASPGWAYRLDLATSRVLGGSSLRPRSRAPE